MSLLQTGTARGVQTHAAQATAYVELGRYYYALLELARTRDALEAAMYGVIAQLRSDGWSWEKIGTALGCTRQAAQQRFGDRCDDD